MGSCRYTKAGQMFIGEIEDGQIALRDDAGKMTHVLNSTASEIWNMCESLTKEELLTICLKGYTFDSQTEFHEAEKAVSETIDQMISAKIIVCDSHDMGLTR